LLKRDMAVIASTVKGLDRFIDAPYREVRIPALLEFLSEKF